MSRSVRKISLNISFLMFVTLACLLGSEAALAQNSFYKGKTIKIVVRSDPGGGYDTYGRLVSRHISKHIPGNPRVIVINMPGAGGIVAANYLANRARRDGTEIAILSRELAISQRLGQTGVKYDVRKLIPIGSAAGSIRVWTVRSDLPIKTLEDIKKSSEPVKFSATGVGAGSYQGVKLLEVDGFPVKAITGYSGTAERILAVLRGEVEGTLGTWGSLRTPIKEGQLRVIARLGVAVPGENIPDVLDSLSPEGLVDGSRSGRPPKLSDAEADEAVELLKKDPRSIKKALATIKEKTGQEISEWTLKRIARSADLRWKRMRKSVKGKRDQAEFERVQEEIAILHEQEVAGEVDVYYFDESGFNLTPEVPYAWQATGETIEIPSSGSKRLNVLGFCNKQQDFHATTVPGYVDSEIVIACFDQFCTTINKKTIVIVDNASMHISGKFKDKLGGWEENGLTVKYLPTYSPELNLIEIVWRFIKYNWLPLSAYLSFKNLKKELQKVLDGIGSEYRITFA